MAWIKITEDIVPKLKVGDKVRYDIIKDRSTVKLTQENLNSGTFSTNIHNIILRLENNYVWRDSPGNIFRKE